MKIKDLRKLSEKELLRKKKEIEILIMKSYAKVKPKIKPEQRKTLKRTIARILTILNEKKQENEKKENKPR